MSFATIISEGNLIPADLLESIAAGTATGQLPIDFGLDKTRRLTDEIAAAWGDARAFWNALQQRLRRLPENDAATSDTRRYWIEPLFDSLGYNLTYMKNAAVVGGRTYAISHRAGLDENAPPVHIEGVGRDLDKRAPSGGPRLSPHALMQEYLNATEHVWGIVTNGYYVRLLRDSSRVTRPSYVQFDLRSMLSGEKFTEFALFYRLLHRSRLPQGMDDAASCLLETYHQQAIDAGGRVRDGLRDGVYNALRELGNGFVQHPDNAALRTALATGALSSLDYYRQLLRLVYRLLFLMVAEERKLIGGTPEGRKRYADWYSIGRLRTLAEQPGVGRGRYGDHWLGLLSTFKLFENDDDALVMGVTALDGDLFGPRAITDLEATRLFNTPLIAAIHALSRYYDTETKTTRRVNYPAMDVEELGGVYESLLDYRPVVTGTAFDLVTGTERKTTGSFYTRPELVHELIVSALEPVLAERLAAAGNERTNREEAILAITVCDPACGSGHFLLAAARRLGTELARVRTGEAQPSPDTFRHAVRDVIGRCIYGVDANPLAVDLCKLALWIESFNAGLPLSFLDSHIRWGNSLIGTTRALVEAGIPDGAFDAVTGDDKKVATAFKKRNAAERKALEQGQSMLPLDMGGADSADDIAEAARRIDVAPDNSVPAVRAKAAQYARLHESGSAWWQQYCLHNLWTAAFFMPLTDAADPTIPTTRTLNDFKRNPKAAHGEMVGKAFGLAQEIGFFHWQLEFPQVFTGGGFDVVLGNPPWERIKLQEQEHWVDDPYIRDAANKAEREKRIKEYRASSETTQIARVLKFDTAKYQAEAESRFIRASNRFPLTAVGDVNTYALFAEHVLNLRNLYGRAGVIVPTGIATDNSMKQFFNELLYSNSLVSLFGFINSRKIFPAIKDYIKFALITFGFAKQAEFMFMLTTVPQIYERERRFVLSEDDFRLLNPNTLTCPVFRTRTDAELSKKIYHQAPVLIDEKTGENNWGVRYATMFHMANDSGLFFNLPNMDLLPLYESKMMFQFDHRFSTYENATEANTNEGNLPQFSPQMHSDTHHYVLPKYWVSASEIKRKSSTLTQRNWLIAFRDITSNASERTAICSILPKVGVGHTLPLMILRDSLKAIDICCFFTTINSLVLDYLARQKIGGVHLSFFIVNQFPVLPPSVFNTADIAFISERVLELVYTAWDVQPFATDVWAELDEAGKARVRARWQECNNANLPPGNNVPSPFIWNDERRAHIRAELDARIARLYGLSRDELRYILDPADVYGPDFPSETFRVLKEKEIKLYGEYRTRRLVLEKWDAEDFK